MNELDKLVPVDCLAHGAGGNRFDVMDVMRLEQPLHPPQCFEREGHRFGSQAVGFGQPMSQTGRLFVVVEHAVVGAVGVDLGDDQADGVAADVDSRQANGGRGVGGAAGRRVISPF